MGDGKYSVSSRSLRAEKSGYFTKSSNEIFEQQKERKAHKEMQPKYGMIRESRDSEEHPNSVPIIIGLDTTGSMGDVPMKLIKDGLPTLMSNVIQKGIKDAQILFVGVGDHEYDNYPLQVGQFESSDEAMDMWLTRTFLEGGGGGNDGESYLLSWFFAAYCTSIDSFEKRGEKGFLITIGDEPCLPFLPGSALDSIFGGGQHGDHSVEELLKQAMKTYDVYHIHLNHNPYHRYDYGNFKELLGQNFIITKDYNEIPNIISDLIVKRVKSRNRSSSGKGEAKEDSNEKKITPL